MRQRTKLYVKLSLYAMQRQGERGYRSFSYLTSALHRVSGQRHASVTLYSPGRASGTHWIGGWVGLRASLSTEPGCEFLG
jgi:hypothetical protein